jgi:predicted branched-subunit amino acid permease
VPEHWGLGFAGVLCLVGILCSLATNGLRVLSAVVAAGMAMALFALPLRLNIIVAVVAAVMVCMGAERLVGARQRKWVP